MVSTVDSGRAAAGGRTDFVANIAVAVGVDGAANTAIVKQTDERSEGVDFLLSRLIKAYCVCARRATAASCALLCTRALMIVEVKVFEIEVDMVIGTRLVEPSKN